MRLIASIVVLSTVVVFASGALEMFAAPSGRRQLLTIHKASFIVWLMFTGLHVVGHLPRLGHLLRRAAPNAISCGTSPGGTLDRARGWSRRWLVRAIGLIPQFAA